MFGVPRRGLILAIETSNPSAWTPERRSRPGVALGVLGAGGNVELAGVEPIRLDDPHYDDLAGAVARLFERCGAAPGELARVAVSVGPGGYTAVRVAVMTAKMIALATGAECVPVESARVAADRVARGRRCAVCLASKGADCYAMVFGQDGSAGPGRIVDVATMEWDGLEVLVADRFLPGPIAAGAAERGIAIEAPELDPAACLELGAGLPAVPADAILPIYPRIPEAVRKWRDLGNGVS